MKQLSTSDQLLLMAYGDLDPRSTKNLQLQIQTDPELFKEWQAISLQVNNLDNMMLMPSETSLKIVLEHSYKTEHLQEI